MFIVSYEKSNALNEYRIHAIVDTKDEAENYIKEQCGYLNCMGNNYRLQDML